MKIAPIVFQQNRHKPMTRECEIAAQLSGASGLHVRVVTTEEIERTEGRGLMAASKKSGKQASKSAGRKGGAKSGGKQAAKKGAAQRRSPQGQQPEPKARQPPQHQAKPGREAELEPRPHYEAPRYKGAGKLQDKVALITGGDSGIGRAVAVLYAREGADVAIVYLPEEQRDAEETRPHYEAPRYKGAGKLKDKVALITGGDSG